MEHFVLYHIPTNDPKAQQDGVQGHFGVKGLLNYIIILSEVGDCGRCGLFLFATLPESPPK